MPQRHTAPLMIVDESAKQQIISALSDRYSRRILEAVTRKNMSALELSATCDIPVATIYRRLEELLKTGLVVQVKESRNKNGSWSELYRCHLKRISITTDNGTLIIAITNRSPKKTVQRSRITRVHVKVRPI